MSGINPNNNTSRVQGNRTTETSFQDPGTELDKLFNAVLPNNGEQLSAPVTSSIQRFEELREFAKLKGNSTLYEEVESAIQPRKDDPKNAGVVQLAGPIERYTSQLRLG